MNPKQTTQETLVERLIEIRKENPNDAMLGKEIRKTLKEYENDLNSDKAAK